MPIEFGLLLPTGPSKSRIGTFISDIQAYAPAIKDDIHSLWMSDHLFWGDAPTHEAWTTATYLAAALPDFHIGTLVLGQGYRNPALLGKMAATLQTLSGGRLILGMGAGWKEDEYNAYGYNFPDGKTRIRQLEEAVIIIKRLWYDTDPVTYYGRHYRIASAYCQPKPNPIPPIMIGGSGDTTLRVTAQHANWWNFSGKTPQLYQQKLDTLRKYCEYLGRNPADIRLTWLGKLAVGKTAKQVETLDPHAPLRGTPKQVLQAIKPFVQLGIDYFIFEIQELDNPKTVELITEKVLPEIRKMGS